MLAQLISDAEILIKRFASRSSRLEYQTRIIADLLVL